MCGVKEEHSMPPGTRVRTFIEALQSGRTNTTKALDAVFTRPGSLQNHPHRNDFRTAGAFNILPAWARSEFQQAGLSNVELAHIDSWPTHLTDAVRTSLNDAIQNNRNAVHFFWEPYDGNVEDTQIIDPDANGDITIKFRSPRKNIRQVGADDITVDVG